MKAKTVYYKRLFNLGNFEQEQIGIELEVEPDENTTYVFSQAKRFINSMNNSSKEDILYDFYKKIINDPARYTDPIYKEALKFVSDIDSQGDLPF